MPQNWPICRGCGCLFEYMLPPETRVPPGEEVAITCRVCGAREAIRWGFHFTYGVVEERERPVAPAPRDGYVYFAGGSAGPVKIGFTRQPPEERLAALQTGSPVPLRVLGWVWLEDARGAEAEIHRELTHHRLHGEWFQRVAALDAMNRLVVPAPVD